jgi:ribose 1,5-bisphosphokinase
VLVVGPSGAGKDTVMRAAQARLAEAKEFVFVRRVISRSPDEHEDHEPVSVAEFQAREQRGEFALSWRAHDTYYGVPIGIEADMAAGATVICNASRTIIAAARQRYPSVQVIEITAPPDVLAERLARRGREPQAGQDARLTREVEGASAGAGDVRIENKGTIETGVALFLVALGRSVDWRASNATLELGPHR